MMFIDQLLPETQRVASVTDFIAWHKVRAHLLSVLACVLIFSGLSATSAQVTLRPIKSDPVSIDSGLISGTYLPSGVRAYLGVPYAAPPVRENRWREPQPLAPWQGVYTANRQAPECTQPLRSTLINRYSGEEATSEDCLYLNLWAPADAKPGAKLPVIVFLHGGVYTYGSSSAPAYSGDLLAQKGVIYIAINYRLGVMGFMAHPEITSGSPHHASGNWALLDQLAALQWVARNIAKFGGDPANVTLGGQSAGGISVGFLQASPLAKGLFARVVGMSGGAIANDTLQDTLAHGEANGVKVQQTLKAENIEQMRTMSAERVTSAAARAGYRPAALIDGWVLPRTPQEIFAAHEQNDVPALLGSTTSDLLTNIPLRSVHTTAEYRSLAEKTFGPYAPRFLELYPASTDEAARAQGLDVAVSSGIGGWSYSWAMLQVTDGRSPAWLYRFSRIPPFHPGVVYSDFDATIAGAYHGSDLPYWLGTYKTFNLFRTTRDWTPLDVKLSNEMMDVLVAFARTGNPDTPEVKLPRFTAADPKLIDFGDVTKIQSLNRSGRDFLLMHGPSMTLPPAMIPNAGPSIF